ncbi:hypothetical protein GCM10010503_41510 [Streptomyces lucensis JCM 4490]|uniref:Uncharacterized protein n=1 Tax=Streptomyces lucensis JCM 4490 TaxID=1306176 RepID=A0A918JC02_9ACTN|nr:hypothetical protein GCM10010503_41510 [Streptomyces lucensis JCM 4490]
MRRADGGGDSMSELHIYWLLCAVLAVCAVLSPVLRPHGRVRPALLVGFAALASLSMPRLIGSGRGWAVAGWVSLGWWLLRVVVPLIGNPLADRLVAPVMARHLTPEQVREQALASLPTAERVLLGVWPNRMIMMMCLTPTRRHHKRPVMLRSGCQLCFVEWVLRTALDEATATETIHAYRKDLTAGVNRLLVLDRESVTAPWSASVEPVSGVQAAPRADCPAHLPESVA